MPAPTFVGTGAQNGSVSPISVTMPSGVLPGDLLLLVVETGGDEPLADPPSGWLAVPGAVAVDVPTVDGSTLQAFYRYATESNPSAAVGDSGDHQFGRAFAFRGVDQSVPFDVVLAGGVGAVGSTLLIPGVVTTGPDRMVVLVAGRPNSSISAGFGVPVNASLSGIAERHDGGVSSGHGGGFALSTGVAVAAGDIGTSAVSKATNTTNTYLVIALQDAPSVLISRPGGGTELGAWTSTDATLWQAIGETAPNDATFITSPELQASAQATPLIALTAPVAAGVLSVRLRAQRTLASGQLRVVLTTADGTPVGASAWQVLGSSYTLYTLPASTTGTATHFRIEARL